MSELIAWLRSTIEGDKAAAEANGGEVWSAADDRCGDFFISIEGGGSLGEACGCCTTGTMADVEADHIQRHDPRDTIARCEAELALLELHAPGRYGECITCGVGAMSCGCCGYNDFPCDTARLLAKGYRHRPGFNPEWATL